MSLRLEIHHIGLSGGDSTMILVRDQTTSEIVCKVLIDAGGESDDNGISFLNGYLSDFEPQMPFDYLIASHYHADHINGVARSGIPFKRFIDLGGYATGNNLPVEPINPLGNLSDDSAVVTQYQHHIDKNVGGSERRVNLPFLRKENFEDGKLKQECKGPVKITLVPDQAIYLTCYCAGGVLANGNNALRQSIANRLFQTRGPNDEELSAEGKLARDTGAALDETHLSENGKASLQAAIGVELAKVSPNDLSLAFILEFGDFRYYTAGDLSGDLSTLRYANIEEPLIAYLRDDLKILANPITVMKATHHGSNHNNYPKEVQRNIKTTAAATEDDEDAPADGTLMTYKSKNGKGLLDELAPTTIIVPCNQMKGVPGGEFIDRAKAYCEERNKRLNLDGSVVTALKKKKFQTVWQKLSTKRNQMQGLRTITFVNDCRYPQPNYGSKQKAKAADLQALCDAVPRTNLEKVIDRLSNNGPRAVIVYYPRPARIPLTGPQSELLIKDLHLVEIDGGQRTTGNTQRPAQGPELPTLAKEQYQRVIWKQGLQNQLNEFEDAATEWIALNYPSFVDGSGDERRLNREKVTVEESLNLLNRAYPARRESDYMYPPVIRGLNFNERKTVHTLLERTEGYEPNPVKNQKPLNIFMQRISSPNKRQQTTELRHQPPLKRQKSNPDDQVTFG